MSFECMLLEDLAAPLKNSIVGGPFGSNLVSKDYADNGVPVIRGQNMGGKWVSGDFVFVSQEKALQLQQNKARPGDVVFTQRGTLGQVSIVPASPYAEYIVSQSQMKITVDQSKADSQFIYYLFRSEVQLRYILNSAIQTGVPHTNLGILRKTPVTVPSLSTQKAIAVFLGLLDDRITLLHETNATLEAIAQALFKSWFVDFDPVHANAAAKADQHSGGNGQTGTSPAGSASAPGSQTDPTAQRTPQALDPATTALFPDSFEESELGLVPKGWRRLAFTDTVKVIGGGTPKTSMPEYWDGDIPWFSVVDAPVITDVFVIDTAKHISASGLSNSSTKLLTKGTTIISARGTVGRLALVGKEMAMNQSCYGLQGKAADAYFTYFSTYRLVESLKQRSHGSVFDTITTETMKGVTVIYPDVNVIHAFEVALHPVMERIKENLEQAQTLTQLRDTLLPRLISGQLRLPEAQDQLQDTLA